jgi:hypothetical protein
MQGNRATPPSTTPRRLGGVIGALRAVVGAVGRALGRVVGRAQSRPARPRSRRPVAGLVGAPPPRPVQPTRRRPAREPLLPLWLVLLVAEAIPEPYASLCGYARAVHEQERRHRLLSTVAEPPSWALPTPAAAAEASAAHAALRADHLAACAARRAFDPHRPRWAVAARPIGDDAPTPAMLGVDLDDQRSRPPPFAWLPPPAWLPPLTWPLPRGRPPPPASAVLA